MKIVRSWKWLCPACNGLRWMVEVESKLGHRFEAVERWCACATDELYGAALLPEVDPKPPKDGTV